MTRERQESLQKDPHATLTREDLAEGWHFCTEFDFLLTQGEVLHEDGLTCICGFDPRKVVA